MFAVFIFVATPSSTDDSVIEHPIKEKDLEMQLSGTAFASHCQGSHLNPH